jgi:hypothetical protein
MSNASLLQLLNPSQYFVTVNPSKQTNIAIDYQQATGLALSLLAALVTGYGQPSFVLPQGRSDWQV